MKRLLEFVAIAILAVVASGPLLAQSQSNPLVGTWKLNVAKSQYSPGPAPTSLTRTVVAQGDGMKYTMEGVAADGTKLAYGFTVKYDGTDFPITGSMPGGADSIAIKKIDANHYEATLKKAGKVIGTSKAEISMDGKVTTLTSEGTNEGGQPTNNVAVYDKQ
jgi:hypothetical protein